VLAGRRKLADGVPNLDSEGHTADGSLRKTVRKGVARIGGNALIARDWPIEWAAATRWNFLLSMGLLFSG